MIDKQVQEAIRAAGGLYRDYNGWAVHFTDEAQFLAAVDLVRPLAGEGAGAVRVCPVNDAACAEVPIALRCDGCRERRASTTPLPQHMRNAMVTIAHWPCPAQDDMQAANMREVAREALAATPQAVQHGPETCKHARCDAANGTCEYPKCIASLPQAQAEQGAAVGEPFGYWVYFPDAHEGEFAHDVDELIDRITNERFEVTNLYTAPQPSPSPAGAVPDWVAEVINRRATIEQELFNMVKRGESASPEKLRDIALRLGTPRVAAPSAAPLDARDGTHAITKDAT